MHSVLHAMEQDSMKCSLEPYMGFWEKVLEIWSQTGTLENFSESTPGSGDPLEQLKAPLEPIQAPVEPIQDQVELYLKAFPQHLSLNKCNFYCGNVQTHHIFVAKMYKHIIFLLRKCTNTPYFCCKNVQIHNLCCKMYKYGIQIFQT